MRKQFATGLSGLALVLAAGCAAASFPPGADGGSDATVVHVAAPTGDQANDRASILDALKQVQPGGTVQFAPGTYLIGEMITVSIPQVTLLGHPEGTILRGCERAAYEEMTRDAGRARDWSGLWAAMSRCGILELTGGRATVRNLTFEHTDRGLGLGCCLAEPAFRPSDGGYLIENNTFRNSRNGIRASLASTDTTVIRRNQFINVYHAVSAAVSHFHVTDNDISAPEPEHVPGIGHPGFAIGLEPVPPGPGGTVNPTINVCEHNVIAGNRIEGHPDGIILSARPGTKCLHNVIRDNTIAVRRVQLPASRSYVGPARIISEADSTVVGVPLVLVNDPVSWVGDDSAPRGIFEGNLIEGNHITGAEGLGIVVYRASRNRVVNNTIMGITVRDPYPGNTIGGSVEGWDEANGSGIWVSPGSDENEIAGTTFEAIESDAIVLEGDRTRVELQSAGDLVRDLGSNNRVVRPDGQPGSDAPQPYESTFVDAGGVRMHYLDFGGEGLPLVFVHSEGWDAHTYEDFAPHFTDANRVLAVTRPGYGESEAHTNGFDVTAQAESLIDFLDALGIEQAVFAGNSSPTVHLTYLAEHHPDRVAGVIYLAGLLTHWLGEEVRESDPTGARAMAARASAPDTTARERLEALMSHRPEFLAGDRPPIEVPALAFVGRSGTIGHERFSEPLALVGSALMADLFAELPPSPFRDYFQRLIDDPDLRSESLRAVEDSAAREFLLRLAEDTELQAQVWRYQMETARPAVLAGQDRFRRAFDDRLRLVRLDVSTVSGYEYRESPDLIEPHIRRFLADLKPIPGGSQDTTRHTIIINGHRQGERRMWQESADTWRYEHDGDAYHFPRTERLVFDADGFPLVMEIDGQRIVWDRWVERYERSESRARWTAHARSVLGPEWSRALDEGETEVSGPAYYAALHPVHDLGVLARLLLGQPDRSVPLLPDGTARLEPVGERWVEVNGTRRRIRLFAIHGLDMQPSYVWLDDDGATFADEWSVLAGWEAAFPDLRSASDAALAEHHRRLARDLVPPARERPLVIRGARLFDPNTGAIIPGTTIVVDGSRISAVGPDGTLALPRDAEVLDAAGRTVLPGLWDMHAHHGFPGPYFELVAPLSLAGGITTARDLGMPTEAMLSLRRRIRAGEAVGPRLLMAGWVGGAGGRPTGTLVGDAAEARAAVDRFAELGYVQIKIYNDLPHELVPVVIERAKQHGLRVSGEIPTGMTTREAVEHGYEEIQHIDGLLLPLVGSVLTELFAQPTPARLQALNEALAELTPDSKVVQDLIQLLVSENVAVDPTLTVFAAQGMEPPPWVARVAARFPPQAQRRILDRHLFGYWPLTPLWDEIFGNMSALVGALYEAGVPVLPGTDTEMAASDLHHELALYVQGGIPASEVLTLATLGAARIMGMDDELGSIEPGKLADLILVDGDPTTDIDELRRVVMVVKDGRVYDLAAIHRAIGIEP